MLAWGGTAAVGITWPTAPTAPLTAKPRAALSGEATIDNYLIGQLTPHLNTRCLAARRQPPTAIADLAAMQKCLAA
jgi:hypothetical protein